MNVNGLRRWCAPQTTLVLLESSSDLQHALQLINNEQMIGTKLHIVSLAEEDNTSRQHNHGMPFLVRNRCGGTVPQSTAQRWSADLLLRPTSESVALGNACIGEVLQIVESTRPDRVILVTHRTGMTSGRKGRAFTDELLLSLPVPLLIIGRNVAQDKPLFSPKQVLLPVSLRSDVVFPFTFGCQLAHIYRAQLTVLHVFEPGGIELVRDKGPLSVAAQLPIREMKTADSLCKVEIVVRGGERAGAILGLDERRQFDLIILGSSQVSRKREQEKGLIHRVVDEAHCPVIVLGPSIGTDSYVVSSPQLLNRA